MYVVVGVIIIIFDFKLFLLPLLPTPIIAQTIDIYFCFAQRSHTRLTNAAYLYNEPVR
jgi:hypothetical protein